jgi:hypothetical protein
MKNDILAKFKNSVLDKQATNALKGGTAICQCTYGGGAWTETGTCALSSNSACIHAGEDKYGHNSGSCTCYGGGVP